MIGHEPAIILDIPRWRAVCTCAWWTHEQTFGSRAEAQAAHLAHVDRWSQPPRCPRCGWNGVDHGTDCARSDLPHEVVCDHDWADDVCKTCAEAMAAEQAEYEQARAEPISEDARRSPALRARRVQTTRPIP